MKLAVVTQFGPYYQAGPLAPGQVHSWSLGPFSAAFTGTFNIGAHPYVGPGTQYTQAMAVTFVQTAVSPVGEHYVNFVVKNSHTTPVVAYTAWVSVIEA